MVSTTPGLADTLARDWQRAARFYARFGITESQLRHGVTNIEGPREDLMDQVRSGSAGLEEAQARREASLAE